MSFTTAPQTVEKLMAVFAQFGLPEELVTDGGPQFPSEEFKNFLKDQGVVNSMTPPYHPASNGAAEKAVITVNRALLKQVLQDDLREKRRNIQKLSCFLLAYRTTPHKSTGKAPAELFL
ncbi:igE-binding protein-like [Ixodes scapularis]|uniref:igE-binding protein-like n=1 Tax=Ixodes scapularis TaxID=6945 RepID=UPI001A9DFCA2|nr:igE-binding protein-like [Ixodes scapularis]